MYVLIKDSIIISYSKTKMKGGIFTKTPNLKYGMIVKDVVGDEIIAELSKDDIKKNLISEYKEIEIEAIKKRSEYITAELLPEGKLKTLKLIKLEEEKISIETHFNEKLTELITKFGEGVLEEII